MDLNHILIWTVAVGCGMSLMQLFGHRHLRTMMALPGCILAALLVSWWLVPDSAGYIAGTLFVLLMLIPSWGTAFLNTLIFKRWMRAASWVAWLLAILRPTRDSRLSARTIHALSLVQRGEQDAAVAALKSIPASHPLGRNAAILCHRIEGTWQALIQEVEVGTSSSLPLSDLNVLDSYLQALGETGQRDAMFNRYRSLSQELPPSTPPFLLNMIRVKLAAFSGDDFTVAQLFSGPLREWPVEFKRFWMATALQVSGQREQAEHDFQSLIQGRDVAYASSSQRRMQSPLSTLAEAPLSSEQQIILKQLSHAVEREIQQGVIEFTSSRTCWTTWSIAAVLVLVFLCEIPGGSENFANLHRMGAMLIPADPGGGEWWRMFTAAFLHFGPVHLGMNLMGLIILGRRIEVRWGPWLTLITYLCAAVGSVGLAPYFIEFGNEHERTVLVGASGGVMGLIGGLLIQSLFDFLRGRSQEARREFALFLVVVLLQMAFDASTPNVSSEAHLLGMSIGIFFATVWNTVWWLKSRRTARV